MSQLTNTRKSNKKLSRFQKLWNQAEKLRVENQRFRARLDKLIDSIHQDILPEERKAAAEQKPLLKKLLQLGQRKSMTNWERHALSDWITELAQPIISSGQFDKELEDALSRYEAFNLGIDLDETSDQSLAEQLNSYHQQRQDEWEDVMAPESPDERRARIENEVEEELDQLVGQPPQPPENSAAGSDLFADELNEAKQQAFDEYQRQREELRAVMIEQRMAEETDSEVDGNVFSGFNPFIDGDEEDDDWGDDFVDPFAKTTKDTASISNKVFTRLFRATVAVLHPDREPDEEQQKRNHQLMSQLLKARKQGDVMTVLEMYQQYVGDEQGLTGKDEKQLIEVLQQQIDLLKNEKEEYSYSSPMHRLAYEQFYFSSAKKTDQAFSQHIASIRQSAGHAHMLAERITSLKTLKPHLETRYEEYAPENLFDDFIDEMMRYGPFR